MNTRLSCQVLDALKTEFDFIGRKATIDMNAH